MVPQLAPPPLHLHIPKLFRPQKHPDIPAPAIPISPHIVAPPDRATAVIQAQPLSPFLFHYATSPTDMYQPNSPSAAYSLSYPPFAPVSEPPSPVDPLHDTTTFLSPTYSRNPLSVDSRADQEKPQLETPYHTNILDHRRMSEPAILADTLSYSSPALEHRLESSVPYSSSLSINSASRVPTSSYAPSLQRGSSLTSLRDLRHSQSAPRYSWRDSDPLRPAPFAPYSADDGFHDQISPLQPNFGDIESSSNARYLAAHENHYGSSPPGTGTSTSSAPLASPTSPASVLPSTAVPARDTKGKTYSFIPLPGNNVKKRPRRRYDEIERLYQCSWPDCTKAYGTLNHLNAHVSMQKHGPKRTPNEFKELRKQWRKQKKAAELTATDSSRCAVALVDDGVSPNTRHYTRPALHVHPPAPNMAGSSAPVMNSATSTPRPCPRADDPGPNFPIDDTDHLHHRSLCSPATRQQYPSWHGLSRLPYDLLQDGDHGQEQDHMFPHENGSNRHNTDNHDHNKSNNNNGHCNMNLPHLDSVLGSYHHAPLPSPPSSSMPSFSHSDSPPPPPSSSAPIHRLPPDSTLLTPLPGYQPPPPPPPLSPRYESKMFDSYGRSVPGHGSLHNVGHGNRDGA